MNPIRIAAIYTFAAHYHSGQWSRGYRLLCRARRAWLRRAGIEPRLDYWERVIEQETAKPISERGELSNLYFTLAERYGNEI